MQYFTSTSKTALIVTILIAVATSTGIAKQEKNLLLNAGAEEGKGDLPSLWFKASIPAEGLNMSRDAQNVHSGKYSLAISNTHKYEQTVCNNWAQNLQDVPVGKVIKVSAYIKTENADSVNVCLQCWGLDDSGKMLAFTSTNILRGDSNWVLLESPPVVVPAGTAKITIRAVLTGLGKAWFDDFSVNIIDMPKEMVNNISTAQIGDKKYDQKQIQEKNTEFFFDRIGNPESGYHGFSGLWAIEEKAKISDTNTKEKIIIRAGEIIEDPNQTTFRRWQCCYVISGIGDANGIPSLIHALTKDKDTTVRNCAACALGKFKNEQAINALKQSKTTEKNEEVLGWINKALEGQFLKN
jgi:hypothetical protein